MNAVNTTPELKNRAVLMRLFIGAPGENRTDADLSDDVKKEHSLGRESGKWIKTLYPPEALKSVKKLDGEIRQYHNAVTLPFDSGIGILPVALIMDYGNRMRDFAAKRKALIEADFLSDPQKWIDWAVANHNGTFDPDQYPGCTKENGTVKLDVEKFREAMRQEFRFETQPLPVPDAAHFESTVSSLLGTDTQSVNERVRDAAKDAQTELMKRLIKPVQRMARVLSSDKPRIFDTMIEDIQEIAKIAPSLNLSDDPKIAEFVSDLTKLGTKYPAVNLRDNEREQKTARADAEAILNKLKGYKL